MRISPGGYKHSRNGEIDGGDLMILGSTILSAASTIAQAKGAEVQSKPPVHTEHELAGRVFAKMASESKLKTPS